MPRTKTKPVELSKGEPVVAATDLRGVAEGTTGKVVIVNGLTWIRYWVRFDNGVSLGSINRSGLARPEEWERKLAGGDEEEADDDGDEAGGEAAEAGGEEEGAGDVTTASGVVVPAKLIERATRARERLGA